MSKMFTSIPSGRAWTIFVLEHSNGNLHLMLSRFYFPAGRTGQKCPRYLPEERVNSSSDGFAPWKSLTLQVTVVGRCVQCERTICRGAGRTMRSCLHIRRSYVHTHCTRAFLCQLLRGG